MELELLFKLIDSIITFGLPGTTYFTEAAYKQLVDEVIYTVFISKMEEAVEDAQNNLKWDAQREIFKTYDE